MVIISDEVFLVSKKMFVVNKQTVKQNHIKSYRTIKPKRNIDYVRQWSSFMSSIYLTHPQPYTDGGTYGGDGGGGGGGE